MCTANKRVRELPEQEGIKAEVSVSSLVEEHDWECDAEALLRDRYAGAGRCQGATATVGRLHSEAVSATQAAGT